MGDYIKIEFEHLNTAQKEIIIALLIEMNYEGFEEDDDLLKLLFFPLFMMKIN
jgi:hypothetical protein